MTIANFALDDEELLKYARQCTEIQNKIVADAIYANEENRGNQDEAVGDRAPKRLRAIV